MTYPSNVSNDPRANLMLTRPMKLNQIFFFLDGSATKSPRKVPVLKNSEKLANRALNYAGYFEMAGVNIRGSEGENNEHHWDRSDEMGSEVLGGRLFPSFGVYDKRCDTGDSVLHLRAPFRAHITG